MQPDPQPQRLRSLDWLNFFVADVQTGVGPFIAAALVTRGWNPSQVGTFLTLGGFAGLAVQAPAGALVDRTRHKRMLIGVGVGAIVTACITFAFGKRLATVMGAQLLLSTAGPFIAAALTAITLGLVGKAAFDTRLGRNSGFNSAGNVFAALLMGWVGWRWGVQAIFFTVPLLALPALLALLIIPANQINHEEARGSDSKLAGSGSGMKVLFKDRALLAFAASAFLFHLANAAMLPQLGEMLAHGQSRAAAPFTSAAVSVTQIVIALTASSVGELSARWGPRRLLLIGYGVLPLRGLLYTVTSAVPLLIAIQTLDGVANAIFGVASAVYVAQRTRGSGHFNLAMGAFGTAVGCGAALSTVLAGFFAQHSGFGFSFSLLAVIAMVAFLCLAIFVPDASADSKGQVPMAFVPAETGSV